MSNLSLVAFVHLLIKEWNVTSLGESIFTGHQLMWLILVYKFKDVLLKIKNRSINRWNHTTIFWNRNSHIPTK